MQSHNEFFYSMDCGKKMFKRDCYRRNSSTNWLVEPCVGDDNDDDDKNSYSLTVYHKPVLFIFLNTNFFFIWKMLYKFSYIIKNNMCFLIPFS